jgi:hypothetical protein
MISNGTNSQMPDPMCYLEAAVVESKIFGHDLGICMESNVSDSDESSLRSHKFLNNP